VIENSKTDAQLTRNYSEKTSRRQGNFTNLPEIVFEFGPWTQIKI
jgi:hypothetical protein